MPSLERPAITNTVIDVSPYDLGKAIANWDSEEQALVLQGLSDQLHALGTVDASAQAHYTIEQLNGRADYLLGLLHDAAHDRAADPDRYDFGPPVPVAVPARPVPWEVVQGRVTFPTPVIPAEAWDKARGITPEEPIMDEFAAVEWEDPAVRTLGNSVPCPHGCGWDHTNHVPLAKTADTAEETDR